MAAGWVLLLSRPTFFLGSRLLAAGAAQISSVFMSEADRPKINLLYENGDLLVLNKPSGLVVNRSATAKGPTLQDWVEENLKNKKSDGEGDFGARSGVVHRLDKGTSGVILVAKNSSAFKDLQRQFKRRVVKKEYLALVHGQVKASQGEIDAPIKRDPRIRERFAVVSGGRKALTRFRVVNCWERPAKKRPNPEYYTLLRLFPLTGRTHQIRVHLKHIGHPVVADPLYGGRRTVREDEKWSRRIFLHAASLGFFHPRSGAWLRIEAPLPLELEKVLVGFTHL